MRTRALGVIVALLCLTGAAGLNGPGASAELQQSTPAAVLETPAATTEAAATAPATNATPQAVATKVVTLVTWYQQDPAGGPLKLGPISVSESGVAKIGQAGGRAVTGTTEFEDAKNSGLPRIVFGDSILDAYAVNADDPATALRWLYLNDDPNARPATLVMQVSAVEGPYKGSTGTATFVSRATGEGGVVVIVLTPPS